MILLVKFTHKCKPCFYLGDRIYRIGMSSWLVHPWLYDLNAMENTLLVYTETNKCVQVPVPRTNPRRLIQLLEWYQCPFFHTKGNTPRSLQRHSQNITQKSFGAASGWNLVNKDCGRYSLALWRFILPSVSNSSICSTCRFWGNILIIFMERDSSLSSHCTMFIPSWRSMKVNWQKMEHTMTHVCV